MAPAQQSPLPLGPGTPGLMPVDGTAALVGTVVDAATGGVIAHAAVRLEGPGLSRVESSNAHGGFDFLGLASGTYTLSATKAGDFDGAYGKSRPDGTGVPVTLQRGQWLFGATVAIFRPAAIAGIVEDEAREPVVAARVQALRRIVVAGHPKLLPGPTTMTDDLGAFRLSGLPPGEYVVAVPSPHITLPSLAIRTFAALANGGRAVDTDPATLVNRNLSSATFQAILGPATARDDPDGRHILIGNAPSLEDTDALAYPTTFYPSVTSAVAALSITVASGERREGLVMTIAPVPARRVSGRVEGPAGSTFGEILRLIPEGEVDVGFGMETGTATVDLDGTFTFFDVPPGRYEIEARSAISMMLAAGSAQAGAPLALGDSPVASALPFESSVGSGTLVTASLSSVLNGTPPFWGDADVVVGDRNVDDVVVLLQPTATVHGTVAFDGATPPPQLALTRLRITAEPADGRSMIPSPVTLDETGNFALVGLPPGRFLVRVAGAPPGWTLKSAIWQGTDFSVVPLDTHAAINVDGLTVTLTSQPAIVWGTVHDTHGLSPAAMVTVIVFPADSADFSDDGLNPRRLKMVRADANGVFTIAGLPPGSYNLVAIDEASAAGWNDPARLAAWRQVATRIGLKDGEQKSQDLKLVGGR